MLLKNGIEMTSYKNAKEQTVTMYTNTLGYAATICCGDITLWNNNGDIMCGAANEDAAINMLLDWNKK